MFYPYVAVLSGCLSTLMLGPCYGAPSQTQYLYCRGNYSNLTYDDCQGKYHNNQAACYHIPMHSQYKPCAGICNNRLYPSRAATKCHGVCPCKLAIVIYQPTQLAVECNLISLLCVMSVLKTLHELWTTKNHITRLHSCYKNMIITKTIVISNIIKYLFFFYF